jgi:serine/threonine-protein kinase
MEYLDGEALDLWLQKQPGARVPLVTALELLLEICAPVAAAHRANVIHRDLKPSNVFVCKQADGTRYLKILDFGLAKRVLDLDGNTKQTSQSMVSGTPDYMAPEQARGLSVSPRSDIYALGVIAFELFTGSVPFDGATPMDVMVAHVGTPAPLPSSREPSLPPALDALVARMLAKAPEARPQTLDEVRTVLEDAVMALGNPRPRGSGSHAILSVTSTSSPALPPMFSQPTPAPAPARSVEEPPPVLRSNFGRMTGLVLSLGLLGSAGAWVMTRPAAVEPTVNVAPTPPLEVAAVVDAGPDPVDAGPEFDAGVDAGIEAPLDAGVAGDGALETKKPTLPPTAKQLRERIAKLEGLARKKKTLERGALQQLVRLRVEATRAGTPALRANVDRAVSEWELRYFKK